MASDALALLDTEGGGRFAVPGLRPATEMTWQEVVAALQDESVFMRNVFGTRPLPAAQVPQVQRAWIDQSGLLDGSELERMLWTVRRFYEQIEADLLQRYGVDLGELWRDRHWRRLLNLIDHLPRATWTQQAIANDAEYAEQVAATILGSKPSTVDEKPYTPPLVESTPEVVVLRDLVDAVNNLRATLIMANSKAGTPAPKIPPYPRPETLVDTLVAKAKRAQRWSAHDTLANRLLPNRKE